MFISIDVGGTNIRVAGAAELADPVFAGEPLRRPGSHDFDNDLAFMVGAALEIANGERIEAVGIGAPGYPNKDKTEVSYAVNLPEWMGKPLVAALTENLDNCPVFYDEDTVAAGLGEAYYADAKNGFDYLVWGTGIGGSRVQYDKGRPMAAAFDWLTYFKDWHTDNSGAALLERFGKAPESLTLADWQVVGREFGRHLAAHVQNHAPAAVVFAGGVAVRHADIITAVSHDLDIPVRVTEFGDDSGLMGGFGLICDRLPQSGEGRDLPLTSNV